VISTTSNRLLALLVMLPMLLSGCAAPADGAASSTAAAPGDLPRWVLDPLQAYPPVRYITAVGSGRTLDEAERDAHDKLARRFRVLLDSRETQHDAYLATTGSTRRRTADDDRTTGAQRSGGDDDPDWERSTSLLSTVRLSAKEQLLNAQILERHHGSDGVYYALGALERLPTARLYAEQMRINADLAETHYQAAQATPEAQTITRLAHLKTAETAARSYRALAHIHDVLSGMGGRDMLPGSAGPDLAAIEAAYDELQHSLAIALDFPGASPAGLRAELRQAVNDMGLALRTGEEEADLTLELAYDVSLRDIARYDMVRADWRLTVAVRDAAGRQIATITYAERDAGRDRSAALQQAEQRAARAVAKRLPGDLFEALYNETAE
jgi:hypothetical protein